MQMVGLCSASRAGAPYAPRRGPSNLAECVTPIASPDLRGLSHNPAVQNGEMGMSLQDRSRGRGCGRVNIPFPIMSCHFTLSALEGSLEAFQFPRSHTQRYCL